MTKPLPKQKCTDLETLMIRALGRCSFLPASFEKRLVRDIQGADELTEKQRALLHKTFYRYRRQIGLTDKQAQRAVDRARGIPESQPLLIPEEPDHA